MELPDHEQRLSSIETRMAVIEAQLKIIVPPTQVTAPQPQAQTSNAATSTKPWVPVKPIQTAQTSEAGSGNWLGIIAILCFVLAAGFIIKLSIDTGWLTPVRQEGLAALLGFSLIGAGFVLLKSDRDYASYLPGAGIIILYLTAFAAHRYYDLISFEAALGLSTVISGFCIWVFTRIENEIYPVTAAVGAYLAPFILGLHAESDFSLYYFLICSVAFAAISIALQTRILTIVAAYLAIGLTALIGFELNQNGLIASALAGYFIIFSVGTYFYSYHTAKLLTDTEAWGFLPVLLLFYAAEYYFINLISPGFAPWISLVFATFLLGLYLLAERTFRDTLASQPVILAFATIVAFHSIYLELLPHNVRPWLFVLIMLIGAFAPLPQEGKWNKAIAIPVVAMLIILAVEYLAMLYQLVDKPQSSWLVVAFASLGSIWLMLLRRREDISRASECGLALLSAAHILAIVALYRLTTDHGSLAVSASWLLYAVAIMITAFMRKDELMAKSALFVLGFAAGKALLYDAASAPTVVRIFCLLLTGAVLYACGYFMRKVGGWKNNSLTSRGL